MHHNVREHENLRAGRWCSGPPHSLEWQLILPISLVALTLGCGLSLLPGRALPCSLHSPGRTDRRFDCGHFRYLVRGKMRIVGNAKRINHRRQLREVDVVASAPGMLPGQVRVEVARSLFRRQHRASFLLLLESCNDTFLKTINVWRMRDALSSYGERGRERPPHPSVHVLLHGDRRADQSTNICGHIATPKEPNACTQYAPPRAILSRREVRIKFCPRASRSV